MVMYRQVIDCEVGTPVNFFLDEETHQWIADCPCLKITTQAETKEKADSAFAEALKLWLVSCISRNVLAEALTELGFAERSRQQDREREGTSQDTPFVKIRILTSPIQMPSLPVGYTDVWRDVERDPPIWSARFPPPAASPVTPGIYHAATVVSR